MAATLKQIAALTGLSIPTVHQILNNYSTRFAEATRTKVLSAAAELNYRPNISARSLVTQRSFLVGVLFYGVNYPIVASFMRGVQTAVKGAGCTPIFLTHRNISEESENLQSVLERRVDGLIVNAAVDPDGATNATRLAKVHAGGLHVVEVFGQFVPGVPKVTLDYREAARVATERLVAEGHRRIALLVREHHGEAVGGRPSGRFWIAAEFCRGYEAVVRSSGLEPVMCVYPVDADDTRPNAHFLGAASVVPTLFADPATAPTAVVCYSVEAAEATVRCYEGVPHAVTCPLTVTGFGEIRPAVSHRVRVVSLPFPAERAGRLAVAALFDGLAGRAATDVVLGPEQQGDSDDVVPRPSRIRRPNKNGRSVGR